MQELTVIGQKERMHCRRCCRAILNYKIAISDRVSCDEVLFHFSDYIYGQNSRVTNNENPVSWNTLASSKNWDIGRTESKCPISDSLRMLRNSLFVCWVISYGRTVKIEATSFCSRSPAGVVVSNPAGGKDISWVLCQVQVSSSGRSLVRTSPTECDREASTVRRPWPTRGCCEGRCQQSGRIALVFCTITDSH